MFSQDATLNPKYRMMREKPLWKQGKGMRVFIDTISKKNNQHGREWTAKQSPFPLQMII